MTNIKKNRITYEYFFKKQFYGTEGNLLDLSNLFSDYKLIYYPENNEEFSSNLLYEKHIILTDKATLVLENTDLKNCIFLCTESHKEFQTITRIDLIEIFSEYFETQVPNDIRSQILSKNCKESIYSILFKIHLHTGKFDKSLILMEDSFLDPIPFFYKEYFQLKQSPNTEMNQFLISTLNILHAEFLHSGNISLPGFFITLSLLLKQN